MMSGIFTLLCLLTPQITSAATNIYYSVGQNTSDHKTGSPTVTISGNTATFSIAQTATNLGIGDKVTWGNTGVGFITGKTSTSVWSLSTATGGTPTATTSAPVNSITHAFASLNAAVGTGVAGNATSSSFLNTSNLVSGDYVLNIPLYFDTATDTTAVLISGFTTGASNYIKIYTPTSTSTEVNQSQRHDGSWNETRHKMHRIFSSVLTIKVNYIRLEGLQLFFQPNGSHRTIDIVGISGPAHIQISKSIFRAQSSTAFSRASYIYIASSPSAQIDIFNNIFDRMIGTWNTNTGAIIYDTTSTIETIFVFNNTFVSNFVGILHYPTPSGAAGIVARNNLFYNTSYDVIGTFGTTTNYNSTSSSTLAYTVTGGGNTNDRLGQAFVFVDSGSANYRLIANDTGAKDVGVDLSGHASLPFSDDIIGVSRPQGAAWNIGAFEYTEPLTAPVRSARSPNGALASTTVSTTISLSTNQNATCKYSTASSTAYASMPNTFSTTGGTSHSTNVSGLVNGTRYTYYVRCESIGVSNDTDYDISFWIGSATYYVDNSGSPVCSDSNTGIESSPWCTVQKSANTMLAGDTTIVKAGTYPERVTTMAPGTVSLPITFQAASTTAIVNGFLVNHAFQIIDGFTMVGTSVPAFEGSVTLAGTASSTRVTNNIFNSSPVNVSHVVMLFGSLGAQTTDAYIAGNRFLNPLYHGVSLLGSGHTLTNNYFTSLYGGDAVRLVSSNTTVSRNTFRAWNNTLLSSGSSLVPGITYFFLTTSGDADFSNVGAGAGPYTTGEGFTFVANGTTPNNWGSATLLNSNHPDLIQSFSLDPSAVSQYVTIERNLFIDCERTQIGNIESQTGNNVRYWTWRNNIWSNVDYVMSIYAKDFAFYNNIFHESGRNSGHPIIFTTSVTKGNADNGKMFNNIFVNNALTPTSTLSGWYASDPALTGFEADHNLVIGLGAGTTKTGFQTGGLETNGINGLDPLFMSTSTEDFRLQFGSPAINAGTSSPSSLFTIDYASTTRPQGSSWDIGAYEYVESSPVVTTTGGSSTRLRREEEALRNAQASSVVTTTPLSTTTVSTTTISTVSPVVVTTLTPTLREFIDLLISLGIIPPDKAEQARTVVSTPSTPTYSFTRNLQLRDTGTDVRTLQTFLVSKGYLTATPNGVFGPQTLSALKSYQSSVGIPPTGYFGPLTRGSVR